MPSYNRVQTAQRVSTPRLRTLHQSVSILVKYLLALIAGQATRVVDSCTTDALPTGVVTDPWHALTSNPAQKTSTQLRW